MDRKEELFQRFKNELENNLELLEDKPEETIESSVKALWLAALGHPASAEKARELPLPDLTDQQTETLQLLVEQRKNHKPLAYITGRQNFMGIELLSDSRALIPRKETEILGTKALALVNEIQRKKQQDIRIIDVCCGAGNLALAMAYYNAGTVVFASDLSQEAVDLARENVHFLNVGSRVEVKQGDLFSPFENEAFFGTIDLIVCNPPYVTSSKVPRMHTEISSNEPVLAFDGGMLGIKIIQRLIQEAPGYLSKEGWVAFEVGAGQGSFVIQLCEKTGSYRQIEAVSDFTGNIRVVAAQK